MGSCFSKKEKENEKEKLSAAAADSREPPGPESPQEEKVKEVLSETPKPRPSARRTTGPQQQQTAEEPEKTTKKGGHEPIGHDQRSEDTLDVYSIMSESFSASTPLADQKKKKNEDEEEEEVEEHKIRRAERSPARRCHHQRKRSFSGELQQPTAGVKVGCRSGRSSPSPPVGRTHSARESPAAARIRPLSHSSHQCEKFRRDHSGDRSVRRSLSPARKLAAAPDHRRSNGGGQCRGLSGRCSPQRAAAAATEGGTGGVGGGGLEEESLENPLVSLECFIFL